MLQFGRVICLVALVILTMISDLHLAGKLVPRPVQAKSTMYRDGRFLLCK